MTLQTRISRADPWGSDPLAWLIAPTTSAQFLSDIHEQAPLVVHHDEPARFASLLSIGAIDRLIAGTDLKEGQIDLADAARNLTRDDYLDGNRYADRGKIVHHYRKGATIILQQLHALDPVLSRFCAAMEHVFSCHVQTNIYLTPPSNQGFRTHYDNHDVMVVQVEGEKLWRFYNSFAIPYRGEGFNSNRHEIGEITHEFLLKAGDVAYVPRGLMHDARTSGTEPSLHITMGIMSKTWAELMLEAVGEVALREPMLRRSLPPGFARNDFDRDTVRELFAAMAARVGAGLKLDPAMDLFADTFIRTRGADTRGGILDAGVPVTGASRFIARPFAPWRIETSDDGFSVVTAGGARSFASQLLPAAMRALSGAAFEVSALEGAPLDDVIGLCGELLAYGLLETA